MEPNTSLSKEARSYLSARAVQLLVSIEQMHKECARINNMLLEDHRANMPQPTGGLTSGHSSVRHPYVPTPLREMAPAFREASEEIDRSTRSREHQQPTDSYFPVQGMDGAPTIPPQRNQPALSSAKSMGNMRGTRSSPDHPASRPAVPGQSRFPHFHKLKPSLYKDL